MNPVCIKTILSKLIGVISNIGLFYLERYISNMKEGERKTLEYECLCVCVLKLTNCHSYVITLNMTVTMKTYYLI